MIPLCPLMQNQQSDNPKDHLDPDALAAAAPQLAAVLSGDLYCWSCKYDLTGLSVTGTCPECGTPVRATLLAIVDPQASSFAPMRWPVLSAAGLLIWSAAAFCAILVIFLLRVFDVLVSMSFLPARFAQFGVLVPILAGVSAVGALVFIRPHCAIRVSTSIRSIIAAFLYIPLVAFLWGLHARFDIVSGSPYLSDSINIEDRVEKRIVIGFLILAIALLLRSAVREYAARSVLMRTGQLTRQTLLAFAAAVVLTLLGDTLHLVSLRWPAVQSFAVTTIWMALVVIGSGMIAFGFGGMLWDSVRLYPVIRRRPRSLGEIIRKESTPRQS
ncbi:MAG: hypothetical protein COB69_01850 [Phycisphaera sp.]|nr:MAG: hypothetical protein COB69_01850 [Phycisphaera sp.]